MTIWRKRANWLLTVIFDQQVLWKVRSWLECTNHSLQFESEMLLSGRRFKVPWSKSNRFCYFALWLWVQIQKKWLNWQREWAAMGWNCSKPNPRAPGPQIIPPFQLCTNTLSSPLGIGSTNVPFRYVWISLLHILLSCSVQILIRAGRQFSPYRNRDRKSVV